LKDPTLYKCGPEALHLLHAKQKEYDEIITSFKPYLDRDNENIPELTNGLTLLQVISDYQRYLYTVICHEMRMVLGEKEDFEKHRSTFRYALSGPAMLTDIAKTLMREATIRSGIVNRTIILIEFCL
jgi:hypothetical protein